MMNFYELQWYVQITAVIASLQLLLLAIPTIIIKAKPGSRLYRWLGTRNATNCPCLIIIKSGLPKSVLCQEWYEQEQNRFLIRGLLNTFYKPFNRRMELIGHEIEVQAAIVIYNDVDEGGYRLNEAIALSRYKSFKGYATSRIVSMMKQVSPDARDMFYEINKIKRVRDYE